MVFSLAMAAASGTAMAANPMRIASINLCADQFLWHLADRRHIVSLSYLAADPEVSAIADQISGVHLNHGAAEQILPLQPDLVVAGKFAARPAVNLLRQLGYRVLELDPPRSVDDAWRQIESLGEAIGEPERARSLIARMSAELGTLEATTDSPAPTAINYQPNGFATGANNLVADVMRRAGLSVAGFGDGEREYGHLPLEVLVSRPPDILIVDSSYARHPSLAHGILANPAFAHLEGRMTRVEVPNKLWICGGPELVRAAKILASARGRWLTKRGTGR